MFRHGRLRNASASRQGVNRLFPSTGEAFEDGPTGGIGEGLEDIFCSGLHVMNHNHMVMHCQTDFQSDYFRTACYFVADAGLVITPIQLNRNGTRVNKLLMTSTILKPIGTVHSTRTSVEDDNWDAETTSIELDASQFSPEAFAGLADFSHVEVLFLMDRVDARKVEMGARHPRNNTDRPRIGIFAQRGKNRPNQIGCTICKVLKVDGLLLRVEGLDAIDGSPVLDVKPWVAEFGPRGAVFQPTWISELMREYWHR